MCTYLGKASDREGMGHDEGMHWRNMNRRGKSWRAWLRFRSNCGFAARLSAELWQGCGVELVERAWHSPLPGAPLRGRSGGLGTNGLIPGAAAAIG